MSANNRPESTRTGLSYLIERVFDMIETASESGLRTVNTAVLVLVVGYVFWHAGDSAVTKVSGWFGPGAQAALRHAAGAPLDAAWFVGGVATCTLAFVGHRAYKRRAARRDAVLAQQMFNEPMPTELMADRNAKARQVGPDDSAGEPAKAAPQQRQTPD